MYYEEENINGDIINGFSSWIGRDRERINNGEQYYRHTVSGSQLIGLCDPQQCL
ncbi:hypothetical protein DSOL_3856 [Desulfosporosinus metallidurans]|uniref:Uncharacterized protein n=1 Tax=Desulfosporosinus metallidurans TaxID=1888891 RepID=A0A1Q8QN60_9FIRM|nr:hypothetical protein DSOL_3856 [Desulfosporosinus metallidurans]